MNNSQPFSIIFPHKILNYLVFFIKILFGCTKNKLAKSQKMRKPLGMLGLKKFGPGKLRDEQVWVQNILIDFFAELNHSKKINFHFFWICTFKEL